MSPQKKLTSKPLPRKVSKVSGIVSKKTIRKAPQKLLKKAPKKLSLPENLPHLTEDMIDSIGAGIYLAQKGKFVSLSPTLELLTGYAAKDLVGKNLLDHVHPEDRQMVRKNAIKSLKKKSPDTYEYRFIKKNGELMWVLETVSSSVYNESQATLGSIMDITRYKQTQDTLKRLGDRYSTILEEINEGYGELDLDGNWTFVNESAAKNIGYTQAEIIGKNYRQLTDEASGQKMFEAYSNLYKTGEPFKGLEVEFITKQGNRRIKELSGTLIRDEKGQPVGFRGLSRDITERKWAEDALLQSEARYFSIIESFGDVYFETDLTGLTTFINDKACQELGYTREELLNMSNRDLQDEVFVRETYAIFNEVYETGRPVREFQYTVNRKNGTKAVWEMSISLMRDAYSNPIGFRGLAHDVTERKKMEDALRASEERARTIIATIPDPYVESDLHGNVTYVNAAYVSLIGYSVDELKTTHYTKYLDKKNTEVILTTYNTVYKTGLPMKNMELEFITKNGEKKLVNLSVSLIRDPQGKPTGFHSIVRDVTEKKKAEELIRQSEQYLREYSEKLELRVRERTAELEKSKVAAEAASRAKSDFMAHISHEFQTPLNAVIGFTKVLNDRMFGELNEKQEEFIHYISDAGQNLSRIITEIVDVTHVASGNTKLAYSAVSIVGPLSKTIKLLASQIEEKKQILTVDVALDADVPVEMDEQKIQQVFFHLLSNAVKYTGSSGKVYIQATRSNEPVSGQEGIRVAFRDTGIGIKQEDIPKIFQTFGMLDSPYIHSGKGIGIGLSLTKQLVELQGGTISVESEYGKGSCFTIFLPLKQKPE